MLGAAELHRPTAADAEDVLPAALSRLRQRGLPSSPRTPTDSLLTLRHLCGRGPRAGISKSNWSRTSWGPLRFKICGVLSDTNVRNKEEMVTSGSETTGLSAKYAPRSKWT